ncbi:integral membrane regulatory protein [Streptomyces mashuensis]|uniref:Integral membrane regulatory protein n=1 Tax=Streptomyces mashuensis TaxID=33904 RepID=A0A919BAY1_9ACTN|nr:glycosyltransferase family 2 protein [Streptomyces mashuensis]GHF74433.1 integral membrane regulatory protein [Streptomyces mashuensis]
MFDPTPAPAFPRHVVTAVLVAHDGARWLPDTLAGLLGQQRPVQQIVAADTGSADDSRRLLADALGDDRVLHLARRAGFGTAVDEAVRAAPALTADDLPHLRRSSGWDPVSRTWADDDAYATGDTAGDTPGRAGAHGEPVQWLWLLHDDSAPTPSALHELLRVADAEPEAAVVGPKLRGWYDRRQLLEAGVTVARGGRRWTGLERREQDQGQHDRVRRVLAVSTAGMLVRRDVWEALGGFDPRLPLMRDDVDLCWRVNAAGHRVLVAPGAVLHHAEAASRERRPVDCAGRRPASPHRVDKAGAVHTLLANTRGPLLPYVLLRIVAGTLLRALGYLVGKVPGQALDEVAGLVTVLLRPGRLRAARRRRGEPTAPPAALRPLFPPPGATVRAAAEQLAGAFGRHGDDAGAGAGRHGAVESGPAGDDADYLEAEQFARLRRLTRRPAPVLFTALLLLSLAACRHLFGTGTLAGGALLPAPGSASALWAAYTDGWHPTGTGTTAAAPPHLALLAVLGTLLLGSTGAALTLLLVLAVPLAGLTAYVAARPLTPSRTLRAWAALAYALLPALTGALATGRLGTAVLAVLLPLLARTAVTTTLLRPPQEGAPDTAHEGRAPAVAAPRRRTPRSPHRTTGHAPAGPLAPWRATWTYALVLTLTTAFTPVVWLLAVALATGAGVRHGLRGGRARLAAYAPRQLTALVTPLVVLAPWSLGLLAHPGRLLDEPGVATGPGTPSPLRLLTADPGGPGTPGGLLLLGVLAAALAALLRTDRRTATTTAWAVAGGTLLGAVLAGRTTWPGPLTLTYGLALITAAVLAAEGARERLAARSFGWRQPLAGLVALTAGAAPLVAAFTWAADGTDGPLHRRDATQVPAFVAEEARTPDRPRTLVLGAEPGRVAYALVRGAGARLGDADHLAATGPDRRLDTAVAGLVAGTGTDQTRRLGAYAIGYVLLRGSDPAPVAHALDRTPGLTRLSRHDHSALWRVEHSAARLTLVPHDPAAPPQPVAAGPVGARTALPTGPGGRVLRLADRAAPGWRATLDGRPLKPVTLDGWAQGFTLPAGGGRLALGYETPAARTAWLWTQGLLAAVLVVLALPARRRRVDDDLPLPQGTAATVPAQAGAETAAVPGEGRRARRRRAAAAGAHAPAGRPSPAPVADPYATQGPAQAPPDADPYAAVPHQQTYPGSPGGAAWDTGAAVAYDPYGTTFGDAGRPRRDGSEDQ